MQQWDVIVVGTSLAESILSGAISRHAKVLHIDPASRYGASQAVVTLLDLAAQKDTVFTANIFKKEPDSDSTFDNVEEVCVDLNDQQDLKKSNEANGEIQRQKDIEELITFFATDSVRQHIITSCDISLHILMTDVQLETAKFIRSCLLENQRFNLELSTKTLLSRGEIVSLLIKAGIQGLEFKLVDSTHVYEINANQLRKVPGGKDDVFVDSSLSLLMKRRLMKFLTMVLELNNPTQDDSTKIWTEFRGKPLRNFLESLGFNQELITIIITALALDLSPQDEIQLETLDGLQRLNLILKSAGMYGRGVFLVGIYGTISELCQSFCRYSAVYGTTFMLNTNLKSISMTYPSDGEPPSVIVETIDGNVFESKNLVIASEYRDLLSEITPKNANKVVREKAEWVHRGLVITDRPICGNPESISMLIIPPSDKNAGIHCLQGSQETSVCPKDKFILSMTTSSTEPKNIINEVLNDLIMCSLQTEFAEDGIQGAPKKICTLQVFFSVPCGHQFVEWVNSNVVVMAAVDSQVLCERVVADARGVFEVLYPGKEFYPARIDPNDE